MPHKCLETVLAKCDYFEPFTLLFFSKTIHYHSCFTKLLIVIVQHEFGIQNKLNFYQTGRSVGAGVGDGA
jgi:hypothetical protein